MSDIYTVVVDSLKALDPERPLREALDPERPLREADIVGPPGAVGEFCVLLHAD